MRSRKKNRKIEGKTERQKKKQQSKNEIIRNGTSLRNLRICNIGNLQIK